jgi:lysophospholipase L1-like esterase
VRIGLYGDSTQYGETEDQQGGPHWRAANTPESVLQAAMDAEFGAGSVIVTTHAIPGSTLADLLAGTGNDEFGVFNAWPSDVGADDIELENFGINDWSRGITPEQFAAELAQLHALHPHGLVFETPLPAFGDDRFAPTVRDAAKALGVPLIDVNAWFHASPTIGQFVHDGIHPDSAGYALVTQGAVAPAVASMVRPLRCMN